MDLRKFVAEAVGTALLVFLAVGVATLSFGFRVTGSSTSAGVDVAATATGWLYSPVPCVHVVSR